MSPTPHLLTPHWSSPTQPLRHTWSGVGNVDQFRWLLRADVQQHLTLARDELGLRHVRACAMFSPELRVWTHRLADWCSSVAERPMGANWQNIDIAIEALLRLGLKPIYTTCFTPQAFTEGTATCWPDRNAVSPPRDLEQWSRFVKEGVQHQMERFGRDEVRSWYFEVWNEPNLSGFWAGSQEDFFRLWSSTYRAIKAADPELRVGGPSTARGEWVLDFLDWTARDGTRPDYLITHVYNNDSEAEPLSPFDGPASHRVKDSPHFASGVVRGLKRSLEERGWTGEIHWNEWGRSWFPHDPLKETALEAAFIVKTMAEVSQEADYFAFWCLSDIYDQCGFSGAEFDGNYGLLSLHGLRKPGWQAHVLLERLGREAVPVDGGDGLVGALATLDPTPKVLIYCYPYHPGTTGESVSISLTPPPGRLKARLTRLGQDENNIIAAWQRMGAPAYPTLAQLAHLRSRNPLAYASDDALIQDGKRLKLSMERPGVALIEFE